MCVYRNCEGMWRRRRKCSIEVRLAVVADFYYCVTPHTSSYFDEQKLVSVSNCVCYFLYSISHLILFTLLLIFAPLPFTTLRILLEWQGESANTRNKFTWYVTSIIHLKRAIMKILCVCGAMAKNVASKSVGRRIIERVADITNTAQKPALRYLFPYLFFLLPSTPLSLFSTGGCRTWTSARNLSNYKNIL